HLEIKRLIGNQSLQPPVLFLELFEPTRLADLHAPVLRTPAVKRGLRNPFPATEVPHHRARIRFLEQFDDLLFREPTLPHDSSVRCTLEESHYNWIRLRGSAQLDLQTYPTGCVSVDHMQ